MFERGKVILVPFPFTDLSAQKIRPALILCPASAPGSDVIVAFISSVLPVHPAPTDVMLSDSDPSFPKTGLRVASVIRCDKIATLDKRIVLGELGTLVPHDMRLVDRALHRALGLRT